MKLISKNPYSNYFWVENYNDEDKKFFESLGFSETQSTIPKGKPTLNLEGNQMFGLWDNELTNKIVDAVMEKYGECVVYEYFEE